MQKEFLYQIKITYDWSKDTNVLLSCKTNYSIYTVKYSFESQKNKESDHDHCLFYDLGSGSGHDGPMYSFYFPIQIP